MAFVDFADIKSVFGQVSGLFQKPEQSLAMAPEALPWDTDLRIETRRNSVARTSMERGQMEDLNRIRNALYTTSD